MTSRKKTKKTKAAGAEKGKPVTTAFQLASEDGAEQIVGIGNLRVMLFNDDGSWFAQGLEIDYFAQGETVEEVQENFQRGLTATIAYHLSEYDNISAILQPAPREAWKDFLQNGAGSKRYSHVSLYDSRLGVLPFAGVDFYSRVAA